MPLRTGCTCKVCGGPISDERRQLQPRVVTCSPACAAEHGAELRRRAAGRQRERLRKRAQ